MLVRSVWVCVALGLAAGLHETPSRAIAQEAGVEQPAVETLTSFAAFWSMSAEERDRAIPFLLECDVLYYDSAWQLLWVRDASGASYVEPGPVTLPIAHGQRIRVKGVLPPPNRNITFAGSSVEVLGRATLTAMPLDLRRTDLGRASSGFVEIDGLVDRQSVTDSGHLQLVLSTGGREVLVWVMIGQAAPRPDFVGSSIRVRGVCDASQVTPRGDLAVLQIWVPNLEMVDLLSTLEEDPRFAVGAVAIRDIPRMPVNTRIRVMGELLARSSGEHPRLRDATGEVDLITTQTAMIPAYATVEAIGFPVAHGTALRLEDAVYRRTRSPDMVPVKPAGAPPADQGGQAAMPTIKVIQEYWNLPATQRTQPVRLDLECTVLHYDSDPAWNQLWVRDETGGMFPFPGDRPLPIRSGQRIRVTGVAPPHGDGLSFADASIMVLHDVPLVPVPLGDWREFNPRLTEQLVWAEALVDRQTASPTDRTHLRLFLSIDGRMAIAWVLVQPGAPLPDLVGSLVRVSGIYNPTPMAPGPLSSLQLMVPSLEQVEVIGQLSTDPRFERPAVAIDALRDLPPEGLVRIVGEVHSQQAGRSLVVRDPTGQAEVLATQSTVLAVHEKVEAIGRPRVDGLVMRLEDGVFRRMTGTAADAVTPPATPSGPSTLYLAANVLELSPEDADQSRPAEITGVVTWAHPDYPYLYIQDSSGGVRVQRGPDPGEVGKTGRNIEARGVTAMGRFAPEVVAERLQRIGVMVVPEAPMVSLEHALTGVEEAQWVAMRGYLRTAESRTNELGLEELVLQLATSTGDFEAVIPTREDLSAFLGAVVRLRGVCTARADELGKLTGIQLRVNDASFLQVEEPAPEDVFRIPARSLESLGRFATTQAFNRRVRVQGTVLHATAGRFIVHAGGVSLVALTRETRLPRPGDRVDAVGFLGRQGPRVVLRETVYRGLGAGVASDPAVLAETADTIPGLDGQLVRVVGSVLDAAHVGSSLVLTVQRGSAVFSANLEGTGRDVRKGSQVQLTGVYDVRYDEYGQARSFAVLMRGDDDLVVLRPPSPFTTRRVLTFSGVLALGTAGVFGWVVALRRRVRRQTEQIRAQLEREGHLQRELERAQRLESLGLLAGGIAHDFNNLLTVVMGNISLARLDEGIEAETRETLGDAERAITRARDLTHQLLTFSKGGAPIREAVDLAGVVREVTEFVLHGMPVRPVFRFAPALWPADVDKGQVGQVVQNIIINGAQAMPEGGAIEIDLDNVEVSASAANGLAAGRYLRLTIRDHGRGISAEDLPRIFDPYFTTKPQGSGLGLATVYSIVKRHGGEIAVDSEPGKGSRVQVWLPAADGAAGVAPAEETPAAAVEVPRAPAVSPPSGAARVLVMDDEEAIQKLVQTILRRAGYEVTIVGDGASAVREYASAYREGRGYAVVIFDLTVPGGMGGLQALEEVRRIDPAVRAIVSSGYSNDPSLADHRGLGFSAMVAKPYEVATLLQTVQAVVRNGVA